MNRKRMTFRTLCALAFGLLCSCSSNNSDVLDNGSNSNGSASGDSDKGVVFNFTTEDFGVDKEVATRGVQSAVKSKVVDLGNGIEAVVEAEKEQVTKAQATRAISNSNYTIYAFQSGVLKASIKGKFSGGKFTAASGSQGYMLLDAGNYDFVAHNDDVSYSGGKFVSSKPETAMMATQTETIGTGRKQTVSFAMKHFGARFKLKFQTWAPFSGTTSFSVVSRTGTTKPSKVYYDPTTKAYTHDNASYSASSTLNGQSESGMESGNTWTGTANTYAYTYPGATPSDLNVKINSGSLYEKNLSNASIPLSFSSAITFAAGDSYIFKVKLYYKKTYLFSDGTTGTLLANITKTPVAVVVDESRGLAIALKSAGNGANYTWNELPRAQKTSYIYVNSNTGLGQAINQYTGSSQTWDLSSSLGTPSEKVVKGDAQSLYPAFYAAGHYTLVVAGKKWFLPSIGEWKVALTSLSNQNASVVTNVMGKKYGWTYSIVRAAFTQAGGTPLTTWYWTSDEQRNPGIANAWTVTADSSGFTFGSASKGKKTSNNSFTGTEVRAFITYK